MKQHFILSAIFILALSASPAVAQSSADGMKTFAKDGLSFSYPSGWTLTDKSNAQAQHLILSQEKSSVIIMVVAYRELLTSEEQFYVAIRGITEPYVESIAKNFASSGRKVERDNPCIELEGVKVSGVQLHGFYQNEPSTGDVYYFARGRRFVNLIYIRADKDAPRGNGAWEAVHRSITIDKPATADAPASLSTNIISGGLLNSKAVRLPKPDYTTFARRGGASGLVVVEVTIDEQGNVSSATAVKGHPLLKKSAEDAARGAKFPPVIICGQPVKVTGTISYNFISF
jgi:TonB family protein